MPSSYSSAWCKGLQMLLSPHPITLVLALLFASWVQLSSWMCLHPFPFGSVVYPFSWRWVLFLKELKGHHLAISKYCGDKVWDYAELLAVCCWITVASHGLWWFLRNNARENKIIIIIKETHAEPNICSFLLPWGGFIQPICRVKGALDQAWGCEGCALWGWERDERLEGSKEIITGAQKPCYVFPARSQKVNLWCFLGLLLVFFPAGLNGFF